VNGFLIDAVAVLVVLNRMNFRGRRSISSQINQIDYLAEILSALSSGVRLLCRPVVDGVDSQA